MKQTGIMIAFLCGVASWTGCADWGSTALPRHVVDMQGREVWIPDSVGRVVGLRSGCVRLIAMAGGAARISGIESNEAQRTNYLHSIAFPEIRQRPLIGPPFGGDRELLALHRPDVIFLSCTGAEEADELQRRLGTPVVCLDYGDLGAGLGTFFSALHLVGEVLGTTAHTDSVEHFFYQEINEIRRLAAQVTEPKRAYVGGIAYKGARGLTSTDPYYPALTMAGGVNVAAEVDSALVSAIHGTTISLEQLLLWQPQHVFVDASGWRLVEEERRRHRTLFGLLTAWDEGRVHRLFPYNNYHANYECMLLNGWVIGRALYPEVFGQVDVEEKGRELMRRVYGKCCTIQFLNNE
jgi:iron complex transport system substrate-binding protein